ncbi:hypothetical protein MTO96_006105 [Rhipicephalus appendiculatus]
MSCCRISALSTEQRDRHPQNPELGDIAASRRVTLVQLETGTTEAGVAPLMLGAVTVGQDFLGLASEQPRCTPLRTTARASEVLQRLVLEHVPAAALRCKIVVMMWLISTSANRSTHGPLNSKLLNVPVNCDDRGTLRRSAAAGSVPCPSKNNWATSKQVTASRWHSSRPGTIDLRRTVDAGRCYCRRGFPRLGLGAAVLRGPSNDCACERGAPKARDRACYGLDGIKASFSLGKRAGLLRVKELTLPATTGYSRGHP